VYTEREEISWEERSDSMNTSEQYLTVTEARQLMQVSENKIASMIKSGELPAIPNPRNKSSKLIPRSAVDAWLEKASVRPPPSANSSQKRAGLIKNGPLPSGN
jgi:excisionase family DNA binding protein